MVEPTLMPLLPIRTTVSEGNANARHETTVQAAMIVLLVLESTHAISCPEDDLPPATMTLTAFTQPGRAA